jgi:hypothetical protein
MSSLLRCAAALSLAALAVTAGAGAASAATVTPGPTAISHPDPHDDTLQFGPFQVPRYGNVSGGFAWDAS